LAHCEKSVFVCLSRKREEVLKISPKNSGRKQVQCIKWFSFKIFKLISFTRTTIVKLFTTLFSRTLENCSLRKKGTFLLVKTNKDTIYLSTSYEEDELYNIIKPATGL
jgi:hypothetical protein